MKIYCPKCHTCYSVEIGLIPVDGKKFRCSRCGEIWNCTHKDFNVPEIPVQKEDEPAPQNVIVDKDDNILTTPPPQEKPTEDDRQLVTEDEMNVIFARLKDESVKINTEIEQLPPVKKIFPKIKKCLGWDSRLAISLELLTITIILTLSLFAWRYELVRKFPQIEPLFSGIGIPAKVVGEGLEFQNITRRYSDTGASEQLNIKGFVFNTTDKQLQIPPILINILNENTDSLNKIKKETEVKTIDARAKVPFSLLVDIPSHEAQYILLTFEE